MTRSEDWHHPDFDEAYIKKVKFEVTNLEVLPPMTGYNIQVDYLLDLCRSLKEKYIPPIYNNVVPFIVIDAGGVGLPVLDLLKQKIREGQGNFYVYPIRYTAGFYPKEGEKGVKNVPKGEVFQSLMVAMQNGEIEVTDTSKFAAILREEMRNFKITYRESGTATMEARTGHDDVLCSVANGLYALKKRGHVIYFEKSPLDYAGQVSYKPHTIDQQLADLNKKKENRLDPNQIRAELEREIKKDK
jgi:hypothetical protein